MKAVLYDRYGPPEVLRIGERAMPKLGPHGVLIRTSHAALNPKDVLLRKGRFRVLQAGPFPRSCGYDFSGLAVAVGPEVLHVSPGTEVFGMLNGMLGRSCAEYLVADAEEVVQKPPGVSFGDAAAVPLAGLTALQALRNEGALPSGGRVVVNGASGGVGSLAIQIAKIFGAEVIGICSSRNTEFVLGLGADAVRAYDVKPPLAGLERVDVFFDAFGNQSIHEVHGLLSEKGQYVTTVPKLRNLLDLAGTRFARRRAHLVRVRANRLDLEQLARWMAMGRLRAVIDRAFEFSSIARAHTFLETKRARGKVLIQISPPEFESQGTESSSGSAA